MTEPTLKQWKRRALAAQEELATIQKMRQFDAAQELKITRENTALRVALQEIQEANNWAYKMIANKLKNKM